MLVYRLYLSAEDDSVCLYVYKIFQLIAFVYEMKLKGHVIATQ